MAEQLERRAAIEVRVAGKKLTGYAATFGTRATIGDFVERIAKGAFAGTLARGDDVVGLVDHDPGKLLARTRSGTLKLAEDAKGLNFELSLPDTQLGRDTLALVERGDIGGMSFGFFVPKGGEQWQGTERTLINVNLVDVSVVNAFPAYPETTVSARSRALARSLRLTLAKRYMDTFR
jgi:HK97 family phage prohead protease